MHGFGGLGGIILLVTTTALAAEAPTRQVSLEQALARARTNNPSLAASQQTVAASGFATAQAVAPYLPQLSLAASYRRSTLNNPTAPYLSSMSSDTTGTSTSIRNIIGRDSMDSYNYFNAGLNLTQTIYDFGRTGGGLDAARASERASRADLMRTLQDVEVAVTGAFFGVLASQEAMIAAEEARSQRQRHLDVAAAQAEAGTRQRIDVTRARSDLAAAELDVLRARNACQMARVTLNNAMGVKDDIDFVVVRPAPAESLALPKLPEAVRTAVLARPEHRALRERIEVLRGASRAQRAGHFPTLGLTGGLTYAGYAFPDMVFNWSVGAGLSWNLFDGLATSNAVREAEAEIRAIEADLQALELAIAAEVERSILAYGEAQARLEPSRALITAAQETLALAEGRYAAGMGSMIEVTDAQAQFTQAKTRLIQAQYDLEMARVQVLKALGRLPTESQGSDASPEP